MLFFFIIIFIFYFLDFLCPEEEEQPAHISPCLSSLHHALHLVVWCSLFWRYNSYVTALQSIDKTITCLDNF